MASRSMEEEGARAEEVGPEQVLDKAPEMAEEAPQGAPDVPPEGARAPATPADLLPERNRAPAAPRGMPQESAEAPAAPADMPQEAAQAPTTPAHMPQAAEAPSTPADMPQEAAEAPTTPADMPQEAAQTPATAADMPQEGAHGPAVPADIPPEGAQAPAASADVPPEAAQAPAAPAEKLQEGAQAPAQPENVVVTKTMREFPVTSEHYVQVTHINHPHSFFVRLTGQEELLAAVSAPGEPLGAAELQPGAQVVLYSPQANTTVRGQVYLVDTEKDTCDIYARDYGFTEKNVPIKSLYKSPQATTPSLARKCQLAHCQPIGNYWTDKSIEAMKYYLGEERTKIVIQGHWRDNLIVDLYNTCPDDVATMMALTGYTTLGALHKTLFVQPFPIPNMRCFKFRELEPGTKLHVRTLAGRTLRSFYVAEVGDYEQYVAEREQFHAAVRAGAGALPAADMQKGEPVSVFTNDRLKYERAVITQINYPVVRAFVWFVDAGGQAEACLEDMKCLPERWLQRPAAALYCALPRDRARDPALQGLLQPGRQFHITIKSLGTLLEQPNIVSIDEVVEVK